MRVNNFHCLQKGNIINEYYANLLQRSRDGINKKRPHLAKRKSCFIKTMHHCTPQLSQWSKRMNLSSLPYLCYSPDLAPLDYFRSSNFRSYWKTMRKAYRVQRKLLRNRYISQMFSLLGRVLQGLPPYFELTGFCKTNICLIGMVVLKHLIVRRQV